MDKTDIKLDNAPLEMESNNSPWTELYQAESPAAQPAAATVRAAQSQPAAHQEQMDRQAKPDSDPDDALSLMFYS